MKGSAAMNSNCDGIDGKKGGVDIAFDIVI